MGDNIDLLENGDTIVVDIPNRTARFEVSDEEIAPSTRVVCGSRMKRKGQWQLTARQATIISRD